MVTTGRREEGMYVLTCQECKAVWHSLYIACLCSCGLAVYEGVKIHRHLAIRALNERLTRIGMAAAGQLPKIRCSVCGDFFTPADRRYQMCSDACRAERERLRLVERVA